MLNMADFSTSGNTGFILIESNFLKASVKLL